MKFGNKGNDKKKFEGKKGVWKNLVTVWDGDHGLWASGDVYGGTLLFLAKDDKGGVKGLYKVKKMNFRDKKTISKSTKNRKLPESLVANISMNLEHEANEEINLEKLENLSDLFETTDNSSDD